MSHPIASKKFTPGKSVPRSNESIAAENAKYDAAFLAKVAEGENASLKAQAEHTKVAKAAQKYMFQGSTFESNSDTFQPQLTTPSWA